MSLVRNLTRRARAHTKGEENTILPRSRTVKYTPGTINRAKISLPTEFLSTTNVHALNAPDIRKSSGGSDSSSSSSDSIHSDNDFSSIDRSFLTADNSSTSDLSPITPSTPLSDLGLSHETMDFFSSKPAPTTADPVPAIPQRAPSHSKKAHVELSRQRSFNRSMSPPPTDIAKEAVTTRDTVAIFSHSRHDSSANHPFGRELAKVDEVAETFGGAGMSMLLDEEEQEMQAKGLRKFTVSDYLAEITGQTGGVYEDSMGLNPWM
ncbi:hypothetical protein PMZ80_001744 [Knufia obscura]|uniref:Uncharacterized protein n=2 Tax=Knufia TaxID=430999 RepID=A0AAN8I987_9EURO|nr:hypothetical protein PMZ80_001744 [Knufia obscura]KAK5955431.1 hypothetical protein OHC33_003069 [Knufia fluminis]